ncbi:MAG: TetR/AcrR family transcriptional regulator [Acidimicrobiales bacterium]
MTSENRAEAAEGPGAERDEAQRPLRADARRNYERLVVAARRVFADQGAGAPMEAIAREAGVGVGTLYRHFPRRIEVVEAVYRTDVDELVTTAEKAVANLGPWAALEAFLRAFVRYAQGKRTLLSELHEAFDKNPNLKLRSRERIDQAMDLVISRGQRAGVVRTDIDGSDVMQLLGPMCTNATLSVDQSERLLIMILDGLRKPADHAEPRR